MTRFGWRTQVLYRLWDGPDFLEPVIKPWAWYRCKTEGHRSFIDHHQDCRCVFCGRRLLDLTDLI